MITNKINIPKFQLYLLFSPSSCGSIFVVKTCVTSFITTITSRTEMQCLKETKKEDAKCEKEKKKAVCDFSL